MKLIAKTFIALILLSLALVSCKEEVPTEAPTLMGMSIVEYVEKQGGATDVDTIEAWMIGQGNYIEFAGETVYDFNFNPDDPFVQQLTKRNRENRKARRKSVPSMLDVRLFMPKEDLAFLERDVDSILTYHYYHFTNGLRLGVVDGLIQSVDAGIENDLYTLDKIRLNLGKGSMMVINITIAFIMFGIALNMKVEGFKELLKQPKPVVAGVVSQFVLLPFATFLLVVLFKPPPSVALGMVLVAACPGGNISNFISTLCKGNIELSVALTAVATILAVVMTPFNFAFWGGLYANASGLVVPISIDWWEMSKIVLMLLGLPIALGMTIHHFFPRFANKLDKPMKWFSIIFFLAIVVGALLQNFTYFKLFVGLIFGIVLLHNFVAFLTGYSFATLLKVKPKDRKSITVETGIQNSGLALVLIVNPHLFDGLGGMAFIAAFWGIWHIVSGLILGTIWSRIKE